MAVDAVDINEGRFEVQNKFFFTNLNELDFEYEIISDGQAVESYNLPIDVAPQSSKEITINTSSEKQAGKEYFVNFYFKQKQESDVLPIGHIIANEQILLKKPEITAPEPVSGVLEVKRPFD